MLGADRAIAAAIARVTDRPGAATVALCAPIDAAASRWLVAWVGDCRVYRWSPRGTGLLELLTRDDTFGHLGEAAPPGGSPNDPARMVGNGATSGANSAVHGLGRNGVLALCSDGVHKHLDGADWSRVLAAPLPLAQRARSLVALARSRGSVDDATVLLLHRADPGWRGVARAAARPSKRQALQATGGASHEARRHRPRLRPRPPAHGDRRSRRGLSRARRAGRAAALHEALPRHRRGRLQRVDRPRVAHPRPPRRPRHQAGSRRRPLRPRRFRPGGAGADLRRGHHRRPLGDAVAGRRDGSDVAQHLRGLARTGGRSRGTA
jgi:hypothetical protein